MPRRSRGSTMKFVTTARLAVLPATAVLLVTLAGCDRGQPAARCFSAADGDRGQAGAAHRGRLRRICRPLRRRRFGRDSLPAVRLSFGDPFHRRPDGEEGRPPLHHRPPAVRNRAGTDARQSRAGARQSLLCPGRSATRPGAAAEQDDHRPDLRSAHASQERCRSLRCRAGGDGEFRRARSRSI